MTPTALFCCVVMIVIAIYDGIAVSLWGVSGSVSKWIQRTAISSPMFSFSFGFIAGHLFGYMPVDMPKANQDGMWISAFHIFMILLFVCLTVALRDSITILRSMLNERKYRKENRGYRIDR